MKIAMIGQKGLPSRTGGIDIHVEELSKRLAFLGYEVTFTSTLKALLSNCDIFHYHASGLPSLAFIPRILGKKVVCTVHGLNLYRGKARGLKTRGKFAHKIINVSKNLVQYFKEEFNLETEYIPNGSYRPDVLKPNIIKQKYNLEYGGYILFLSRLTPEKGVHYLMDAFSQIVTDKKLVISGGANPADHYEKKLRRMAKNNKNIIFTGFVRDQELAELFSNAYFYVLPSSVEGMSISLLEAMSYGNCCLVSDIPENTAVVSTMGYSFEKANVADLVAKLNMLLQEESKVLSVKKYCGDYIIRKYNWDQVTLKTSNLYKCLFSKSTSTKLKVKSDGKSKVHFE